MFKSKKTAPVPMIEQVPAAHLLERELEGGWTVVKRLDRAPGVTGGEFSVNYVVSDASGQRAFMKALNIAAVLGDGDGESLIDRLKYFSAAYVAERDLLQQCCDRNMSRVIRLLGHGEIDVPEAGLLRQVPYLILELADGDIRSHQASLRTFDLAWVLRTLKHAAQGLEQLHSAQAAHQDLNPSNVLSQDGGRVMKLGDVGHAARRDNSGPNADRPIPGARGYAPPEQLYGAFSQAWEERRAGDVYQLGSLATQLFLGHSMTGLLQGALPPEFRSGRWEGTFAELIPFLQNAHSEVLRELEQSVLARTEDTAMTADFVSAVREMTAPDPDSRGHPKDRGGAGSSYGVRRYVSLFNRLAARARSHLHSGV